MSSRTVPVTVQILDKEYRVACPEEEREALIASGRHLNKKMKEVRDAGRVVGVDRIAVMVALNMAHELLHGEPADDAAMGEECLKRVQLLQNRIETALNKIRQTQL